MNKRLLNLVIRTHELKGAAYQVMLALAWNSSRTNECSMSISDLVSAAHLTKQSVIRALHSLISPDVEVEGRSILTKVRQGRGTGTSTTYLINVDLMQDLNRLRRHRLATVARGRGTGVTTIPGTNPTNDDKAGNLAVPVEHPLTRTLTGEISRKLITNSGISFSPASKPLSHSEVNKILKAHVKQVARDISAIVNGTKEIVLIDNAPPSEMFEVAAPPHDDNKPDAEMGGKLISGPTRILMEPLSGINRQRLYRSVGASSSKGVQVLPVDGYSTGIRWPRRVR